MNINKNSWHYKAVKFLTPKEKLVNGIDLPRMSLCEYTSNLVFGWLMIIIFVIATSPIWICCGFIGLIIYGLSFIVPKTWYESKPKEKVYPINCNQPEEEPKSLIGKWLWAKKRKVCPILKWTDGEKDVEARNN